MPSVIQGTHYVPRRSSCPDVRSPEGGPQAVASLWLPNSPASRSVCNSAVQHVGMRWPLRMSSRIQGTRRRRTWWNFSISLAHPPPGRSVHLYAESEHDPCIFRIELQRPNDTTPTHSHLLHCLTCSPPALSLKTPKALTRRHLRVRSHCHDEPVIHTT